MIQLSILDFIFGIIAIVFIIYGVFEKVKYKCLLEASKKIAVAEDREDLTGPEKFTLVVSWIDESLPAIFRNSLVRNTLRKIVQVVFDNCSVYMQRYVKRKTGKDITNIIDTIKDAAEEQLEEYEEEKKKEDTSADDIDTSEETEDN